MSDTDLIAEARKVAEKVNYGPNATFILHLADALEAERAAHEATQERLTQALQGALVGPEILAALEAEREELAHLEESFDRILSAVRDELGS